MIFMSGGCHNWMNAFSPVLRKEVDKKKLFNTSTKYLNYKQLRLIKIL